MIKAFTGMNIEKAPMGGESVPIFTINHIYHRNNFRRAMERIVAMAIG